jgi:hypothetical protein
MRHHYTVDVYIVAAGYQIQRLDKMEDSELFKPRSNGADVRE